MLRTSMAFIELLHLKGVLEGDLFGSMCHHLTSILQLTKLESEHVGMCLL